jgi:superfamily II DNA/RNA helicase
MDHIKRGTLKLDNLKSFVLDEADEMLKMGFIDGGNQSAWRKPPICRKSLTNFIT